LQRLEYRGLWLEIASGIEILILPKGLQRLVVEFRGDFYCLTAKSGVEDVGMIQVEDATHGQAVRKAMKAKSFVMTASDKRGRANWFLKL
jgi:hypothetical protein